MVAQGSVKVTPVAACRLPGRRPGVPKRVIPRHRFRHKCRAGASVDQVGPSWPHGGSFCLPVDLFLGFWWPQQAARATPGLVCVYLQNDLACYSYSQQKRYRCIYIIFHIFMITRIYKFRVIGYLLRNYGMPCRQLCKRCKKQSKSCNNHQSIHPPLQFLCNNIKCVIEDAIIVYSSKITIFVHYSIIILNIIFVI